jgi:hypothetical protein
MLTSAATALVLLCSLKLSKFFGHFCRFPVGTIPWQCCFNRVHCQPWSTGAGKLHGALVKIMYSILAKVGSGLEVFPYVLIPLGGGVCGPFTRYRQFLTFIGGSWDLPWGRESFCTKPGMASGGRGAGGWASARRTVRRTSA